MGIVTHAFKSINGIDLFPIIALVIFLLLFVIMVWHTLTISSSRDRELSKMPLDNDEENEFMNQKH